MLHRSFFALIATATIVTPAVAQDVQVWETRPSVAPPAMAWGSMTASRRAIIGVTLNTRPSAGDSLGATISAVTPGGPAARAGLLAGDIITKFNGTVLVTRGDAVNDDDQSGPGLRLIELVSRVEPGDTVAVEWRHERSKKTARIVTQSSGNVVMTVPGSDFVYHVSPDGDMERRRALTELRMLTPQASPPEIAQVFLRMRGPLGGVQFAPINTDLGRYFGVTEGILILDTPDSSAHIDLKGGDVIVGIDARKATDVDQLMRILGSYNDDENINFDVMRDKRHVTVTVKAESIRGGGRMKVMQDGLGPMRTPAPDVPPPGSRPRSRNGT